VGLQFFAAGGTGDLLNAETGVTRITSAGKLITNYTNRDNRCYK
jgi:hypothetical protein